MEKPGGKPRDPSIGRGKEAYEAPEIRKVKIVRGELAVTGCKMRTTAPGPTFGGCFASNCRSVGS
jgi:hypothetical protein